MKPKLIDVSAPEPAYLQLAGHLARQIGTKYQINDRLPTERELGEIYGVSRITVRVAMQLLERRGLIVRRRSKGTFVRGPVVREHLGAFANRSARLDAQGIQSQTKLLEWQLIATPPHIAPILCQQQCMLLVRQAWVGATPMSIAYSYLHPKTAAVSRDRVERTFSFDILEKLVGETIARAHLAVRAETASANGPGKVLGVRRPAPLLITERTRYSATNEPLEHVITYLRAEAYELILDLEGASDRRESVRLLRAVSS